MVLRHTGNTKRASNNGGTVNVSKQEEEKLSWLRQILEWQKDMSDGKEFMSLLKSDLDLFAESVYCFTPAGDVKNLPNGSTPIDFAYSIHSAVGNKMIGARVERQAGQHRLCDPERGPYRDHHFAEFQRSEP